MDRNLVMEGAMRNLFTTNFTKPELTNPVHHISDFKAKMHQTRIRLGLRDPNGG